MSAAWTGVEPPSMEIAPLPHRLPRGPALTDAGLAALDGADLVRLLTSTLRGAREYVVCAVRNDERDGLPISAAYARSLLADIDAALAMAGA